MKNFLKKHLHIFLAILAGIILAASFPPSRLGWLVFFGFLPLFWAIDKTGSPRRALWAGSTAALVYFGWGLRWFFNAWPLDWLGLESNFWGLVIVVFAAWLPMSLLLSFFWGAWTWTIKKYCWPKPGLIFLVPFLFVLSEYLRAWGTSVFWAGSEAKLGPFWTLLSPAYALAEYPKWRNLAGFGGLYGLDFLIIIVNLALFFLFFIFKEKKRPLKSLKIFWGGTIGLLLLVNFFSFIPQKQTRGPEKISVFIVQTKEFSSFQKTPQQQQESFNQQLKILQEISQRDFQKAIIFLPEDQRFLTGFPLAARAQLKLLFSGKEVLLISSGRAESKDKTINLISFYDLAQNQTVAQSPKIFLIPGGEYLPYLIKLTSIVLGQSDYIERFNSSRQYFSGDTTVKTVTWHGWQVGGELCSAMMAPTIYRQTRQAGATLLFNLASHSSFRGSLVLEAQNLAMAKMRAVENSTWFVQATNYGFSFALNGKGEVIQKTENYDPQFLEFAIQ